MRPILLQYSIKSWIIFNIYLHSWQNKRLTKGQVTKFIWSKDLHFKYNESKQIPTVCSIQHIGFGKLLNQRLVPEVFPEQSR